MNVIDTNTHRSDRIENGVIQLASQIRDIPSMSNTEVLALLATVCTVVRQVYVR